MLTVIYAECHTFSYAECYYAECRYAECRHAECHYAECRVAVIASLALGLVIL
jgi:hypothetical protein